MNFNQGVYTLDEKQKLKNWLTAAQLSRVDDEELREAVDRLQREIDYVSQKVGKVDKSKKFKPFEKFDWDKYGETVKWAIEHKFHFDDEWFCYGNFDEYKDDPKFDKNKLNDILSYFVDTVHTKNIDIFNTEFYNDQIDEWAYTQRENKYFFPCERFIFVSRAPGEDVDTFFDYYEISGQGTAFCLDIHRADETDYVDERMKEYFIRTYDRFEEKLIKC